MKPMHFLFVASLAGIACGEVGESPVGDTASSAEDDNTTSSASDSCSGYPTMLSETGLYEGDMVTLADGVRPFAPQFALWTDGASKNRWILLPDGEQIDTSDMDYWVYPTCTRLWKEFTRDGVRVETRLLQKDDDGSWTMVAYKWSDDDTDAEAVPDGEADVLGTGHDIPSQDDCTSCHSDMPDHVIGFSAVQLAHMDNPTGASDELNLQALVDEELLTDAPAATADLFSDDFSDTDIAAMGYLHANCGHCHNPQSDPMYIQGVVEMSLRLGVDELSGAPEGTRLYAETVNQATSIEDDGVDPPENVGLDYRIVAGDPDQSELFVRFLQDIDDDPSTAMPRLGTEEPDEDAEETLETWIRGLAD